LREDQERFKLHHKKGGFEHSGCRQAGDVYDSLQTLETTRQLVIYKWMQLTEWQNRDLKNSSGNRSK
jgi:hypothetical protein